MIHAKHSVSYLPISTHDSSNRRLRFSEDIPEFLINRVDCQGHRSGVGAVQKLISN